MHGKITSVSTLPICKFEFYGISLTATTIFGARRYLSGYAVPEKTYVIRISFICVLRVLANSANVLADIREYNENDEFTATHIVRRDFQHIITTF